MNIQLWDPFTSNIPSEITHSLLDKSSESNKFQGSESTFITAFNHVGDKLACGQRDGRILIWDLLVYSVKMQLHGHVDLVTCLEWKQIEYNGTTSDVLLSGSIDWNVILWSVKDDAKRLDTLRFTSPVLAATLQPKQTPQQVEPIIAAKKGKGKKTQPALVPHTQSDPVMMRVAVIAQGQSPILAEKAQNGGGWKHHFLELSPGELACSVQFSRDARFLFIGTNKGSISIFHPSTHQLVSTVKISPTSIIKHLSFSNSNKYMLVNSSDRIMRSYSMEYDPQDTEPDLELDGKFMEGVDKTQWLDCCFSADGEYVVAAKQGRDCHSLYIWDRTTATLAKQLDGPLEGMSSLSWHPSRPICATVSTLYGCVYLWRHTPQQKFSAYEPTFTELEDNLVYEEREDEFDVVDEQVARNKSLVEVDVDSHVDIMQVEF